MKEGISSLDMMNELMKNKENIYVMVNYDLLKEEYGSQIYGSEVIYWGNKICYNAENKPAVKLSFCFLDECRWVVKEKEEEKGLDAGEKEYIMRSLKYAIDKGIIEDSNEIVATIRKIVNIGKKLGFDSEEIVKLLGYSDKDIVLIPIKG